MGINRANPNGGGGDTAWQPLPARTWRLEVVDAKLLPATRADWKDQVGFKLKVAEADKPKLEQLGAKLADNEAQSEFTNYRCGATLNGFRSTGYQPTKLGEFIAALYGSEIQDEVRDWIREGGAWPGADADDEEEINEGLKWFIGLEFYAKVEHQAPDAQGRIWTRATTPTPVGAIQSDPNYESFGRRKFDQMIGRGSAGQSVEKPAGQPFSSVEDAIADGAAIAAGTAQPEVDEEAELERRLEEARKAKAEKAAANQAAVATATKNRAAIEGGREPVAAGAKPRSYDQVFGGGK